MKDFERAWDLPKTKWAKDPSPGKRGAVLFFYGTFCPFH
jgi:hypothetical protein